MAKVLDSFEFKTGSPVVSAYAKYMDGRVWEIDCKKDHPGCGSSMSVLACIATYARRMGKKVRSNGVRDNGILVVQVYQPGDDKG